MLQRQRVSGWVPVLATAAEMLLSSQAAVLYYGVLHNDPHTLTLAALAAFSTGSVAVLVFTGLWMGISINVASCPAQHQPPPQVPANWTALHSDTRAVVVASDRTEWVLHYSIAQWRGLAKLLNAGYNNLPFRRCREYAEFSEKEWQQLKIDLCRAGLAYKKRDQVWLNEEGRRSIYQFSRVQPPLPQQAGEVDL